MIKQTTVVLASLAVAGGALVGCNSAADPEAGAAPAAEAATGASGELPSEVERLAENVYLFTNSSHRSLLVVTDEAVLATDPQGSQANAERFVEVIREMTDAPIGHVVYSHHHGDHILGGAAFPADTEFIAHRNAEPHLAGSEARPVDRYVGDNETIDVGGLQVRLIYPGPSETDNSLIILVPERRVAFMVDAVAVRTLPWRTMDGADPRDWIAALERLDELDFDILAPGHGPTGRKSDVRENIDYLQALIAAVQERIDRGQTLEEIQNTLKLPEYADWVRYDEHFKENIQGVYRELGRLNPVIDLLAQGKPVFGVYAPRPPRRGRGGRGGRDGRVGQDPAAPPAPAPSASDLATEAIGYKATDFLFDGSMEGGLERALPAFSAFAAAWEEAGAVTSDPSPRLSHPLIVKSPELAPGVGADIQLQLNLGVSGIMFPKVESAAQLTEALAAMRFRSNGGTRPDDELGAAPVRWGLSEEEYREKADLWPLNPEGELINWTIIESHEGLAKVREIAAVPGIGVLWPGAGTLRGLFSTTDADGQRVLDQEAWEAAIQQVLAACLEFDIACGFPARADDIEMRMQQGFTVFVMSWGDAGFRTIEIGRQLGNR